MIMTVVTVKAVPVELRAVAVKTVMTAHMILPHMDPNVVTQHGMNMVLTVPHLKVVTTGIALAVNVLAIVVVTTVVMMVVASVQMDI